MVSDHIDGRVVWVRAFPNPFHHSLAFQAGPVDKVHHINFMVRDIDTIGTAVNRFKDKGVPVVFGPGRHQPSQSIFLYFLDPDGLTFEYSSGMEEFPEPDPRAASSLEADMKVIDMWGGKPDPRFGAAGAIEKAAVGA